MAFSNNPHFFKVVLASALKEQKLEIPRKFVKKYGLKAFLNDQICLKLEDGKEWNVGLTKNNNGTRVWFHHGWQKFVEFYSLKFGYFLVFKYERQSSSFFVVIFDLTATEIEYPVKKIRLDKANEMVKMETADIDDDDDLDLSFFTQELVRPPTMPRAKMNGIKASHQASVMFKATNFQSAITKNPSFTCKISASSIDPATSLNIPKSFAEKNLEDTSNAILEVSDGRIWSVRCGVYWRARRRQKRAEFKKGWRKFAHDNALQVGDVCVFEMVRKKNTKMICFKVEIFRAS